MMINPTVQFGIASDMRNVGGLCASLREFMAEYGIEKPSDTEIVFRELVANAIVHWNRAKTDMLVFSRVELTEDCTVIKVRGQGSDFYHQKYNGISSGDHHRLGHVLINMLTTRLEFNTPGNEVIAWVSREKSKEGENGR